jgi:2-methylcitrate dehydratase PrpD
MGLTQEIAEYAELFTWDSLPEEAREKITLCLVDWFGVTLGGGSEPCSRMAWEYAVETGKPGRATALCGPDRLPPALAAFVNGTAAHSLDYDDIIITEPGHPSGPVIAAALAVAEAFGCTGRELLTAIALGNHVEQCISVANNAQIVGHGWHSTSIVGVFGAAIASAKLLRLDAVAICHCIGIAAAQAAGIRASFGTMTKPLHVGKAASNGVFAALMAQKGFTAPQDVLERPSTGFLDAYIPGNRQQAIVVLLRDASFPTLREIGFKAYPCCFLNETAIECALQLMRTNQPLDWAEIALIHYHTYPDVLERVDNPSPKTGLEGKFSVQFCLAAALRNGTVDRQTFGEGWMRDSGMPALMAKIALFADSCPDYTLNRCGLLRVELHSGAVVQQYVDLAAHLRNLEASRAGVLEKCLGFLAESPLQDRSQTFLESLRSMEAVPDVARFMRTYF